MKTNKLIKQAGAWYEYTDEMNGEIHKFQAKDFIPLMMENEELREEIYKRICESTILQYKTDTYDIESLERTNEGEE